MKYMPILLLVLIGISLAQRRNYSGTACPPGCICYKQSIRCMRLELEGVPRISTQTTLLDLRFNKISSLNQENFDGCHLISALLLDNNLLTNLKNGTFDELHQLRYLYLSKNDIKYIESGVFRNLPKLEHLFLQSNNLQTVSKGTFSNLPLLNRIYLQYNRLESLPAGAFSNLPQLRLLRLDQNPLNCDCKMAWIIGMMDTNSLQVSADCLFPVEMFGKPLKGLTPKDLHCVPRIEEGPSDCQPQSGETSVFNCLVKGDPEPTVVWYKNQEVIDVTDSKFEILSNNTLIIRNVNQADEGVYSCSVKNILGDISSKAVRLVLSQKTSENFGPPKIEVKPSSVSSAPGTPYVQLFCRAVGNPRPIITWSFNGIQLLHSTKYNIDNEGTLTIRPVEAKDHGTYTCSARNSYGRETADANVLLQSPPIFSAQPENVEANIGADITLECVAVGSPEPEIIWYKDDVEIGSTDRMFIPVDGTFIKITNAQEEDSGLYICEARNTLGSREVSAEIKISSLKYQPPRFKYKPYNIEAFIGSSIEMPCMAEGEPTPGIQWQKDGATMQRTGRAKTSLTGSLYINEVGLEDQGRYECIAINDNGRAAASGYLTVKNDPTAIKIGGIGDQYVKIAFSEATEEIDRAINNTVKTLFETKGPHNSEQLFRLFRFPDAPTRELAKAAEIYERTLSNVKKHIDAGMVTNATKEYRYKDILSKEHLDLIAQLSGCTTHRKVLNCSDTCFHKKYRSIDGACNNLDNPTWGSSLTPFRRILQPIYEDGFGKPVGWDKTKKYYGYPKPLARLVSTSIISTHQITPDDQITHMVMQWGQFLDHDLDHALPAVSSQSWDGVDCKKSCEYAAPCFPMDVPPNDPRVRNRRCIDFIRTSAVCGSGMTSVFFDDIQPREQINQLTSYIDASQVYGYSEELSRALRDLNSDGGRLREGPDFTGWKPLLPFASNEGIDCRRNLSESDINCFAAGDIRVNEQSGLIAMHTLWMREHNRIARELKILNPQWNGETIFHEARKIVGAVMQHITYKHWLRFIVGDGGLEKLGEYQGYNPNIQATISNVFATAALRFGHTLINPVLHRFNEDFKPIREGHLPLRYAFFAPWRVVNEGGIDPLLRGLFIVPAKLKKPTENLNSELTEQLFRTAHAVALDLAAMNVQRSRDHGLPGYNEYRKFCNMSNVETFEDLRSDISNEQILTKLHELYGHPGNVDVFVGGVLEDVVGGGRVGPLFQCLLLEQFKRLRDGDRFYYENPGVFSPDQLNEVKKYTLSHILCYDGDNITRITENPFILPEKQGGFIDCSTLQPINLRPWMERTRQECVL
ncbi:peroxidasin [Coccinella septempunctata]|uniref:peroxidasin n=1 Tax=Coccinella septempunctata TaxID=41139 RepID=UPI001D0624DB|nr:peroxidasin [Coccinella septempunctata]